VTTDDGRSAQLPGILVRMTECTRCIMDTSDPDIRFDSAGICSHCHRADEILPTVRWTPAASEAALASIASRIQAAAGKEYDSIIGLSGGVDSSYTALVAHRMGLRPLAVHLDNGWDSELAVENIQRVVEHCGMDLVTYVIDWREFRDLQRAFLEASVVDIELLTDHAILAACVRLAQQHGLRYLLSGRNFATEHAMPERWRWPKYDWTNIAAIHRAYGRIPLKTFPHLSTLRWFALRATGRIRVMPLLDFVPYRRDEATATLVREIGWREYGGKHDESLFTKFYQGAILPTKFGIDKRRAHLSDRLRNGELTRAEALEQLSLPLYDTDELRVESEYVRKKLGYDEAEWAAIMAAPPRSHAEFSSDRVVVRPIRAVARPFRALWRRLKSRTQAGQHESRSPST
jgi:N-acetyl sugar amidotransferase